MVEHEGKCRSLPYGRGVRLGDVSDCKPTYLAIVVLPKPGFSIGDQKLSLEIGAYPWDEYEDVDLRTPVREPATTAPNSIYADPQAAVGLKAISSLTLIIASLALY